MTPAAFSISEKDTEAYENCRAVFWGGKRTGLKAGLLPDGITVLVKEGMLSWLKYRHNPDTAALPLYKRREDISPSQNELIILFASLMGGVINEPEY